MHKIFIMFGFFLIFLIPATLETFQNKTFTDLQMIRFCVEGIAFMLYGLCIDVVFKAKESEKKEPEKETL